MIGDCVVVVGVEWVGVVGVDLFVVVGVLFLLFFEVFLEFFD